MNALDDVEYLLHRSRQEVLKAKEAVARGDHLLAIYAHRELAIRYQATAASMLRDERLN